MDSVKIVSIETDEATIEKVKNQKRKYVDYMIAHGLRYVAIQLMSGIVNDAINLFNSGKTEDIQVHESYMSSAHDNTEINKHINLFKKNMTEADISSDVVDYIEKVSRDALAILDRREKAWREEYERKQAEA